MFTDLIESLADVVQSWKISTQNIVFYVLVAFTFFLFARTIMSWKGEAKKMINVKTTILYLLCVTILIGYINLLQY